MKLKLIVALLFAAFAISCSKDDNGSNDSNAIVGTWFATELKIDDQTASDDAKNGKDILDHLTAKQCYIIKFVFEQDLSVVAENSVNYLEINATSTGLDVPCPDQKDTDNSTYTYNGSTLAIVDSTGKTIEASATVDGNTLTIDAAGLDIPNFNTSGELVFRRQ